MHNNMFKFKIGEFVTTILPYHAAPIRTRRSRVNQLAGDEKELANSRIPLMVIERLLQECPGGQQIHYKCRPHFLEIKESSALVSNSESYWQVWAGAPIFSFNEIELEAFVKPAFKEVKQDDSETSTATQSSQEGTD